jgi:hypothetical protein
VRVCGREPSWPGEGRGEPTAAERPRLEHHQLLHGEPAEAVQQYSVVENVQVLEPPEPD